MPKQSEIAMKDNIENEKMQSESNIRQWSQNNFYNFVDFGLKNGGIHIVGKKGHGKTRLMFSMAKLLRQKARVFIFDGSETWLYKFDKIPTFTVQDRDIALVKDVKSTEEIERYKLNNWHLVEYALKTYKDLLFRLKTRKPTKRGFFVRTVVNYLDLAQREQRATTKDNEAIQYLGYFLEEAQDCFNVRSTTRLEAEEFLTVFNEARNQKEAFYTTSQRLTDFSKTIRTKQTYCIGNISEEDKAQGIRRVEKIHAIDFSKLEPQTWFFEGKTFRSPQWKQQGKPYQINKDIKRRYVDNLPKEPQKSLWQKIFEKLFYPTMQNYEGEQWGEQWEQEDDELLEEEQDWEQDEGMGI